MYACIWTYTLYKILAITKKISARKENKNNIKYRRMTTKTAEETNLRQTSHNKFQSVLTEELRPYFSTVAYGEWTLKFENFEHAWRRRCLCIEIHELRTSNTSFMAPLSRNSEYKNKKESIFNSTHKTFSQFGVSDSEETKRQKYISRHGPPSTYIHKKTLNVSAYSKVQWCTKYFVWLHMHWKKW